MEHARGVIEYQEEIPTEEKTMKCVKITSRAICFIGVIGLFSSLYKGFNASHIAERKLGISDDGE